MKKILILKLFFALLTISCNNLNMENPIDLDETPPLVHIIYPANQSTLSGSVLVTAYAYDERNLEKVRLYLDDSIIFQSNVEPYEVIWNTLLYKEDASYIINAEAEDSSGNKTFSKSIEVTIDNLDNISPSGMFLYPSPGQSLNGIIKISIQAEDNHQVDYIDLFINGDSVGIFDADPVVINNYNYFWDTNNMTEDNISTIHAKIYDNSNNYKVIGPISVNIDNENAPDLIFPQGTITSPPSGSTVSGYAEIKVNAFDNIGISQINFFINGDLYFSDTIPPYVYNWNTLLEEEDQNHNININVIDFSGNLTSLYPITVLVNNLEAPDLIPPNIVIYEPAANQTVSGVVDILTITTDNDSISKVEFYHNYDLAHTEYAPNYTHSWNTLIEQDNSEHIWYAVAYDAENNFSQTDPILLKVDNVDEIYPSGIISYPYAGENISGIITIETDVYDNLGVSQVEFFINDSSVFIDNENPFNYDWNTLLYQEDQQHQLSIIISDFNNNNFETGIFVTVNNSPFPENDNTYPYVSILYPVSGQTISDTINIIGFAGDNHLISQVQFLINNEIISTLNDTPYTFQWNTLEQDNNSEHIIIMTAEDQAGNVSTCQPVLVNIFNP